MQKSSNEPDKIRLGISHGDINSISYEIIMKTFVDARMLEFATTVIFGSSNIFSYYRKTLNLNSFNFQTIKNLNQLQSKKLNLFNIVENEVKLEVGKSTKTSGELAYLSLETACKALINLEIDVLVTGPINKQNIQSDKFNFPGHTEYLAKKI